jgi:hypothetical protein
LSANILLIGIQENKFVNLIYFILLLRNKKWLYCHIILKSMAATM